MIRKVCKCGENHKFKDEMAGEEVLCPKCGSTIIVKSDEKYFDIFSRDKFLINQKHLSIAEKYHIFGEEDEFLMYAERPRNILKLVMGIFLGIIVSGIFTTMGTNILKFILAINKSAETPVLIATGIMLLISFIIIIVVAGLVYGKKNIGIYKDDTKRESIMKIEQENIFYFIRGKYRVLDERNRLIAKVEKNYIFNIIRKRWYWKDANNNIIAIIKEESLILAILRKLLGSFYGLFRINFIFQNKNGRKFGEFNRKFTLRDKYVLDLTSDRDRVYDRKVCIAMGILLDSGEGR